MAKTLADMTPEERPEMVGMWCELAGGGIAVLTEVRSTGAMLFAQGDPRPLFTSAERITPLDRERAWNVDGTPPTGQWEEAHANISGDDSPISYEALHMIAGARVEYLPQVQVKADGGERFWNQIGAPCGSRREAQQALDNLHKHIKNHYWVKDSARILTRLVIDMEEQ